MTRVLLTEAMGAVLRSDIERALDELVSFEEGMRFQGLAVVLAKRRWPEMVASERKGDLGLDAHVFRESAKDGVGRGLVCSITTIYDKIAADAKKVSEHFGDQIQQLVFITSGKVGNPKKIEWADRMQKEFGYGLEIISREDIVSSLSDPENLALCRTYLGLDVEIEAAAAEVVENIRAASQNELENWSRRVASQRLIDLQAHSVDGNGAERDDAWTVADIAAALGSARRLILEAPAGYGKTTALIQVARSVLSQKGTVFLIDLPLWVKSGHEILEFITGMVAFQRKGLTSYHLAQSESVERFHFLLNGWNEVSQSLSSDAVLRLRNLERQFPSAGILVTTRSHFVTPPLPGATRLRLRRIAHPDRSAYVRERLGENASSFLTAIETDPALDDLTRTPFILSEVTSIVSSGGPIPRSRVDVLTAAVTLQEQSHEHAESLQSAPVSGMSSRFLGALAMQMVPAGAVSIDEEEARRVVRAESEMLIAEGQVQMAREPKEILNTLCAHHVLERFDYPRSGYRFSHQLFEEYFAFRALERRLRAVLIDNSASKRADFIRSFVNRPAWTEPLEMLAESLSEAEPNVGMALNRDTAHMLVEMSLAVDLVFAAHLASILRLASSDPVAQKLASGLREWYASTDDHHRQCALAGMLASGMDAFGDIVEPLLSSNDDQTRLRTYQLWPNISPSLFGTDWQSVIRAWSEASRATFVSELLRQRFAPDVSAFALGDSSMAVKVAAIEALSWIGADDELALVANTLDASGLSLIITGLSEDMLPASLRPKVLEFLRERLNRVSDVAERMRTLVRLHGLNESDTIVDMKATLEQLPNDNINYSLEPIISHTLDVLRKEDPNWTSRWVTRRIGAGRLWSETWSRFVNVIPDDLREEMFVRLATQDLERWNLKGLVSIVARDADADLARRAFERLLQVHKAINTATDRPSALEREVPYQLQTLLRAIPSDIVVSAVTDFLSADPNPEFVESLVRLYGRVAIADTQVIDLDDRSKSLVRMYLKRSVGMILEQEDIAGELKAAFGSLLSQVGEPEDIADLIELVRADLTRVREGRAARLRGEQTKGAHGAVISWTHSYVRAIVSLQPENTDDVLLSLLSEREYESSVLEEYARQFAPPPQGEFRHRTEYERIWQARAERSEPLTDESRRARVAGAIRSRIRELEDTRSGEGEPKYLNARLKNFAHGLAAVSPKEFTNEIISLLVLPADFDAYICVGTLERLLFAGVSLPSAMCLTLLDASLERMTQWGMQDHDRWVIVRFLCICAFVDDQASGIAKIRQMIPQARLHVSDLRELLNALGHSRFEGALAVMLELVSRHESWQAIQAEWMDALAGLDTDNARRALLGLVDAELPALPFQLDWDNSDRAAARIAQIAKQDPSVAARLRELVHEPLDESKRRILAKALVHSGTEDELLASLSLMDDVRQPPIPYAVERALERRFISAQAHPTYANALTRGAAASNRLRATLFAMAFEDEKRKRSAYSLLGQIEAWRLDYGRPIDEPRHPDYDSGVLWPPPEPPHFAGDHV
jgi:hypothetical protein